MTVVRARAGETVDAVCYRVLGRTMGVTEAVFAVNPGVAALGATLPAGHPIVIPDFIDATRAESRVYKLWD